MDIRAAPKSFATRAQQRSRILPNNSIAELNALFDACFRIQLEASKAAGRYIPLIIENVKGAQPWVGRAKWHYGSYYLWGDIPALMPKAKSRKSTSGSWDPSRSNYTQNHSWTDRETRGVKGTPGHTLNKVPGKQSVGFNVMAVRQMKEATNNGIKQRGSGAAWFDKALDERRKQATATENEGNKCGGAWFGKGNDMSLMRQHNSRSNARKQASAMIAKIPFPLASYIARVFKPC